MENSYSQPPPRIPYSHCNGIRNSSSIHNNSTKAKLINPNLQDMLYVDSKRVVKTHGHGVSIAMGSSASASPNQPSPNSSLTLVNESNTSNTNTNSTVNVSISGKIMKKSRGRGSCNSNNSIGKLRSTATADNSSGLIHQYSSIYDSSHNNTNSTGHNLHLHLPPAAMEISSSVDIQEFLPVCDALFNVISLAIYFCDIVFDILTAYSFYNEGLSQWGLLCLTFIITSLVLSQLLSYNLYKINMKQRLAEGRIHTGGNICSPGSTLLLATHFLGCGVLWRYFKLFIPLDMKLVKNKVRDLLLLRLVHGFVESAPMLLIQLYLILLKSDRSQVTDLNKVSTSLSLLSLCWALASFSKNIRQNNVHKLMLTWLGIIFQFAWRLGTISCRILSLTLYATIYHYWLIVVLVLHWFSMFIWVISPHFNLVFYNETVTTGKKYVYSTMIAIVYIFCYVNVLEDEDDLKIKQSLLGSSNILSHHNYSRNSNSWSSPKVKMTIYYVTMFLENVLLISVWHIAIMYEEQMPWYFTEYSNSTIFLFIIGSFGSGLVFMCIYYRYFHVKKLNYGNNTNFEAFGSGGSGNGSTLHRGGSGNTESKSSSLVNCNFEIGSKEQQLQKTAEALGNYCHNNNNVSKYESLTVTNAMGNNSNFHGGLKELAVKQQKSKRKCTTKGNNEQQQSRSNNNSNNQNPAANIQGVFNCRFNPAMKRKKKKPTPFIPSSVANPISMPNSDIPNRNLNSGPLGAAVAPKSTASPAAAVRSSGPKMSHPFWKRPMNEVVVERDSQSRAAEIQQKLLEKKQQQLAELRQIEEEIKQHNDIMRGSPSSNFHHHLQQQSGPNYSVILPPPPYEKKQPPIPPLPRPPLLYPLATATSRRNSAELLLNPTSLVKDLQFQQQRQCRRAHTTPRDVTCPNDTDEYDCCFRTPLQDEEFDQSDWSYNNYDCSLHDEDDLYSRVEHDDCYYEQDEGLCSGKRARHVEDLMLDLNLQREQRQHQHQHQKKKPNSCSRRFNKRKVSPSACQTSNSVLDFVANSQVTVAVPFDDDERDQQDVIQQNCRRSPVVSRHLQPAYKSCRRIPSDIESQLSLARSYTLPREFKYRRKLAKLMRNEHLPSTNSSDGDVDSGADEDAEIYSHLPKIPLPVPSVHHLRIPNRPNSRSKSPRRSTGHPQTPKGQPVHETKL